MDGLLIVDKPVGPTSHDVVARVRRALDERRIGHTGTLDPGASGVLPLVLGCATRLAQFLSAADKSYEAMVRLGVRTDTGDAAGQILSETTADLMPSRDAVERALDEFRGTTLQQPPAFSAKKIGGLRSHRIARAGRKPSSDRSTVVTLAAPVPVTASSITLLDVQDRDLVIHLTCSAGFYVRALADALGERLGTGGHVAALRRTRSGDCLLADAVPLAAIEETPQRAAARVIPPADMLPRFPALTLTAEGVRRARNGVDLAPVDFERAAGLDSNLPVRLLGSRGELVGVATRDAPAGLLHPSVVLR
jgi:tRNA pseudouridine55 synthase